MSEKSSGANAVRSEIAIVAGPKGWGDTRESWLARVPRKVKEALCTQRETLTVRIVKALWYGEIENPEGHWAALEIKRAAELIQARKEASTLAEQYQRIAGGMREQDESLYRSDIARLERVARLLRGLDRA